MAEESAPKVSSQPSACHFFAHGKDMLMLRATGQSSQSFKQQVHDAVEKFCTDHAEQTDFVAYFRKTWGHKAGE